MSPAEDLVRVGAVGELAGGMPVYEVGCGQCRRDHWFFLVRPETETGLCLWHAASLGPDAVCPPGTGWVVAGCGGEWVCMARAVAEGRLYRLPEPEPTLEEVAGRVAELDEFLAGVLG